MKPVALIVRHGETKLNSGHRFRSWVDVPLSDKGLEQAHDAANFLTKFPIKRIVASPLQRAITTAEFFAEKTNLSICQNRGLLPWHLGMFSGTDKSENMPALKLFIASPEVKIPGGESLCDFENRAAKFYSCEFESDEGLPVFFTHTSNVTVLETLVSGERTHQPEDAETVKPGGVLIVYKTDLGYQVEPIFGIPEPANYGS